MPAAPTAPAAAPARSSLRVRRKSAPRTDEDERGQLASEVPEHLRVPERRCDVLAQRVERAVVAPRVQQVPLVGAVVDGVEGGVDPVRAVRPAPIFEAGDARDVVLAGADGDTRAAGVRTQVHVLLLARLLPDEADQVAAVPADRVDVVPLAADP